MEDVTYLDGNFVFGERSTSQELIDTVDRQESRPACIEVLCHHNLDSM